MGWCQLLIVEDGSGVPTHFWQTVVSNLLVLIWEVLDLTQKASCFVIHIWYVWHLDTCLRIVFDKPCQVLDDIFCHIPSIISFKLWKNSFSFTYLGLPCKAAWIFLCHNQDETQWSNCYSVSKLGKKYGTLSCS